MFEGRAYQTIFLIGEAITATHEYIYIRSYTRYFKDLLFSSYLQTGYPVHNSPEHSASLTLTHSSLSGQGNPAQGSSHSHVGHPSAPVLYPYSHTPAHNARVHESKLRAPLRAGRGELEHFTDEDGPIEPRSLLPSESTHLEIIFSGYETV